MMTLEEVREALQDRNCTEISRRLGGKYSGSYLRQIANGKSTNPSVRCIEVLSEYLEPRKEKKE